MRRMRSSQVPCPCRIEQRQQLAVGAGHRLDATLPHQPPQLQRIDDIAVVGQGDGLAVRLDQHRLRVLDARAAHGRVAGVPDGRHAGQHVDFLGAEDLVDPAHAARDVDAAVGEHGDAGALLAAMLQRHEAEQRRARHVGPRPPDAEDATRLARLVVAARRGRRRQRALRVGKCVRQRRHLRVLGEHAAQRFIRDLEPCRGRPVCRAWLPCVHPARCARSHCR